MKLFSLLILIVQFVDALDNDLSENKMYVRFLDRVGDVESSYVDWRISAVEFTCLCTNCKTVRLLVVDKDHSYDMERNSTDMWLYTIKINDIGSGSLGEYKCLKHDDTPLASYNWTYQKLMPGCHINLNGTCDNKSNEENCKSTHSYRFTKTSVCAKGVGFDSLCEAIANGITPTNEVSGGKDNCKSEELQLNSNLSNAVYPYSMWLGSCSKKSKLSVELGSMYIVSDKTLKLCFTSPKKTIVSTWNSKNIKPKNDSWYDKISMNDMNEYEYNFDNFQNMAFRLKISFEAKTKSNMTVRVYADFIHLGIQIDVKEDVQRMDCVNGSKVSTVLKCRVATGNVEPIQEFEFVYLWTRGSDQTKLGSLDTLKVILSGTDETYMCKVIERYIYDEFKYDRNNVDLEKSESRSLAVKYSCNITSSESSYTNDTQNGTVKNVFDVYDSTEADSKETLEIYVHIIIALVVLIISVAIIVIGAFMYVHWRKKRDLKYLTGESDTISPSTETVYSNKESKKLARVKKC